MKRYLMIFEGRVQGVGFRAFVQRLAIQYNCTGTIRNMANGMVEMQIQGEDSQIRIILSKIKEGDRFIRVDDIRKKEIALHPDEKRFEVRYF